MTAPSAESPVLFPLGDAHGSVQLVQHVGSDKMIVNAARISFAGNNDEMDVLFADGFRLAAEDVSKLTDFDRAELHEQHGYGHMVLPDRDERLIRYLLKHNHGSPFEHNLITYRVTCPIFVDRQFVRHRVGVSKNEGSGRYMELEERGYTPQKFRKQAPSNRQASVEDDGTLDQMLARVTWEDAWDQCWAAYQKLLQIGVTREQARGVLPLSLYVDNYYTFNVRSLLHFLELRDHEGAQYETQLYARAMAQLAEPLFPVTFREWRKFHDAH